MRFYELLNFQHIMLFVFPTLVFILIFALALKYSHFKTDRTEERQKTIIYKYPEGVEDKNAPFPLAMTLIIIGTVLWGFFYILLHGLLEVKI